MRLYFRATDFCILAGKSPNAGPLNHLIDYSSASRQGILMCIWCAFRSYKGGPKQPQWTRFAAGQKRTFRRPHSKIRDHWTWHNVSWKYSRETLKYARRSSHWVEQLVQSNISYRNLLWKVTIKSSEFLTQNWSFLDAFCRVWASKITFLCRRESGSLRLFGTTFVAPESTPCSHQSPWRLADE